MNNALLKQILKEYDIKRSNAIQKAELQKKQLLEINPRLMEIEEELSKTSLDTSKAILSSNSKEDKAKLIQELKKKSNQLIKEKNNFIKELTKESTNYLKPHFECNKCKDTGFVIKNNLSQMCTCLKQRIYDIAYNKCNIGNLQQENFSTFNPKLFSDIVDKQAYKSRYDERSVVPAQRPVSYLCNLKSAPDPYSRINDQIEKQSIHQIVVVRNAAEQVFGQIDTGACCFDQMRTAHICIYAKEDDRRDPVILGK